MKHGGSPYLAASFPPKLYTRWEVYLEHLEAMAKIDLVAAWKGPNPYFEPSKCRPDGYFARHTAYLSVNYR